MAETVQYRVQQFPEVSNRSRQGALKSILNFSAFFPELSMCFQNRIFQSYLKILLFLLTFLIFPLSEKIFYHGNNHPSPGNTWQMEQDIEKTKAANTAPPCVCTAYVKTP